MCGRTFPGFLQKQPSGRTDTRQSKGKTGPRQTWTYTVPRLEGLHSGQRAPALGLGETDHGQASEQAGTRALRSSGIAFSTPEVTGSQGSLRISTSLWSTQSCRSIHLPLPVQVPSVSLPSSQGIGGPQSVHGGDRPQRPQTGPESKCKDPHILAPPRKL